MLSEGCKRSIMAGTIFRFNTVSPLPRLRIIRSKIISKRDQCQWLYLLFDNPFTTFVHKMIIWVKIQCCPSIILSEPIHLLQLVAWRPLCMMKCQVLSLSCLLSRINIMEHTKCLRLRIFPHRKDFFVNIELSQLNRAGERETSLQNFITFQYLSYLSYISPKTLILRKLTPTLKLFDTSFICDEITF